MITGITSKGVHFKFTSITFCNFKKLILMTIFNAKGCFLSFCELEIAFQVIITCVLRNLSIIQGKQFPLLFQYMILHSVYIHTSDSGF